MINIDLPDNRFYKVNGAKSIGELPQIGQKVIYNDNEVLEPENLECVLIKQDDEMPEIYYAFFKSLDDENLNTLVEDGISYYTMRGYSDII